MLNEIYGVPWVAIFGGRRGSFYATSESWSAVIEEMPDHVKAAIVVGVVGPFPEPLQKLTWPASSIPRPAASKPAAVLMVLRGGRLVPPLMLQSVGLLSITF